MTPALTLVDPISLDASADLQTVLAAWHGATLRLEQTHEALRGEVQRLTQELEIKNRELVARAGWPTSVRWPPTWPTRCATAWCR